MFGLDWKVYFIVLMDCGIGIVSGWFFVVYFVKVVVFVGIFIVLFFDELVGIKMRLVIVFVVDVLFVEYGWLVLLVEFWEVVKCKYVGDDIGYDFGDWWVVGYFDDWFV